MKKHGLLVIVMVIITTMASGCGGGSGSSNDVNYVGDWQGGWVIPALASTGREIITINESGNLNGKLYSPEEVELANINGSVNQDGTFSVTYQFSGADGVTLNGIFKLKNGVLTGTTKYQYNGHQYDMVFTLTTRAANQYAGVWGGSWIAGANNGVGSCTIGMDGLIAGTIEYSEIGTIYINGISDNSSFSFSYEYGSEVYNVVGAYSSYINNHLTGTFTDTYLGNGTFDVVELN